MSLATTPERAAVIVGDLLELGAPVWPHVLRTAGSLMITHFLQSPGRVLLTGILIFLNQWLMFAPARLTVLRMFGPSATPGLLIRLVIIEGCCWLAQFQSGRILGRKARHHALAVSALVAVLNLTVGTVWLESVFGVPAHHFVQAAWIPLLLWQVPMMVGMALSEPRRSVLA